MLLKVSLEKLNKLLLDGTEGYCTHCGSFQHSVAPEARNDTCETCSNTTVFGVDELVALKQVQVLDFVKKEAS